MKAKPTTIQGMVLTAWVLSAGCSSSNFAGSSPAKSLVPVAGAPQPGEGLPTGLPAAGGDQSIDSKSGSGGGGPGGGGPVGGGPVGGAPVGGAPVGSSNPSLGNGPGTGGKITDSGDCTSSTSLNYNIVFAFDNTGSQIDTDPTNVRGTGGQAFVDQFLAYVQANPKAKVNMNVLSFNTVSIRSADGWLALSPDHAALIKADITTATANPNGNTSYTPVLSDAAALLSDINRQTAGTKARNYLIFLTDGLPNKDRDEAIRKAAASVVSQQAAIIAIASGPDVPADGEAVVRALALPTIGTTYPDLVGQYYRAATPDDLKSVWSSLSTKIGSACNGSGT